jgi:exonuclease 3'-5' domain-containing protein 1
MGPYHSEPESICDTAASVVAVLPILQAQLVLAMTCQGYALGYKNGVPSILSFATIEHPSQVFHFDLITLDRTTLEPLFNILRSPSLTKAVFDGRLVASALLHNFGVGLVNFLDMQIADVTSRTLRGESAETQRGRISYIVPRSILQAHSDWAQSLLCLNEEEECAKEHKVRAGSSVERRLSASCLFILCPLKMYSVPTVVDPAAEWGARPFSSWSRKHATDRVYLISAIYAYFHTKGYITDHLPAQSARYLSLHRARMPELSNEEALPILPLGTIEQPSSSGNELLCERCGRMFPGRDVTEEGGAMHCLVCFVAKRKNQEDEESARYRAANPVQHYDSESEDDIFW